MDALLGKAGAEGRDHFVSQNNNGLAMGLRVGNWKLQRYYEKFTKNHIVERKLKKTKVPQFQLFDLANDPAEKNNVIEQHPDVADQMKARLKQIVDRGRTRNDRNDRPAEQARE